MADPYTFQGNPTPLSRLPRSVILNPPMPPVNPFRTPLVDTVADPSSPTPRTPIGAQPPGAGGGSIWDALKTLFSSPSAQGQGMTGMLNRSPGSFANTNPSNRYG